MKTKHTQIIGPVSIVLSIVVLKDQISKLVFKVDQKEKNKHLKTSKHEHTTNLFRLTDFLFCYLRCYFLTDVEIFSSFISKES